MTKINVVDQHIIDVLENSTDKYRLLLNLWLIDDEQLVRSVTIPTVNKIAKILGIEVKFPMRKKAVVDNIMALAKEEKIQFIKQEQQL